MTREFTLLCVRTLIAKVSLCWLTLNRNVALFETFLFFHFTHFNLFPIEMQSCVGFFELSFSVKSIFWFQGNARKKKPTKTFSEVFFARREIHACL